MDITTFKICRRIVNGCGSFYGNIAEEAASLNGHRIFLVCDPILAKLGLTEKTAALLREKGFEVAIHADVEPEPRVESVLAAAEQARAFGADCVIGIGGGSSLDTAKTCSVLLGNQQDIRELYGIEKVSKPGAPLILVPTSAGTGSEVTDIAILSDEAAQLKMGIVSRHMLPASVILDPELTLSLPKGPTAASGMDALIHAMEAYTSIHATPLTDMWAEHAIALIAPNLRKAWARGEDIQARQAMLTGSFYAGVAFCNAGVTAVHAFAYPIGARYHIPHGLANTLMLLPVFRFNMVGNMERFARLAAMLGENTTGLSHEKAAGRCLDALESLARDLQVPRHLADYGVTPDDVPVLAESVLQVTRLLGNNPRSVSLQDAINIYQEAL